MRTIPAILGLSVVLAAGVTVPSQAATVVVVRSTAGSAVSADLELSADIELRGWGFTGTGRFQAFAIAPLRASRTTSEVTATALNVPGWRDSRVLIGLPTSYHLKRGRYRVFLISDAPATVRLTLPGRLISSVRAERSARASRILDQYSRATPPYAVQTNAPVSVTRTFVLHATRWTVQSFPVAQHSVGMGVGGGGGQCGRQTGTADAALPLIESPEYLVAFDAAGPDLNFRGPGCAISTYDGTDYPSRAESIVLTVNL